MSFINAHNIVVEFPVFGMRSQSIRNVTIRTATGGRMAKDSTDHIVVRALDGISFEWKQGDRVGLVGHNGSGKTTLLQTLAGIFEPVAGELTVKGKVASMLSITLGMDGEVSGYDNIFIRGTILGMSREEISRMAEEVIEFSELGEYIYMPMRTYSSGMAMRLAFAISTNISSDVVLMDEWLSAGDAEFSEKAEKRLNRMIDAAKILVIASHSPDLIDKVCNRVIHLEHGKILSDTTNEPAGVEPA